MKASKGEPDRSKRATQADQPSQSVQTDLTDQSGPSDQSEPSDRHVLVDQVCGPSFVMEHAGHVYRQVGYIPFD